MRCHTPESPCLPDLGVAADTGWGKQFWAGGQVGGLSLRALWVLGTGLALVGCGGGWVG